MAKTLESENNSLSVPPPPPLPPRKNDRHLAVAPAPTLAVSPASSTFSLVDLDEEEEELEDKLRALKGKTLVRKGGAKEQLANSARGSIRDSIRSRLATLEKFYRQYR